MRWFLSITLAMFGLSMQAAELPPLKLLFLGDNGHHRPVDRFRQIQPVLARRGIDVAYTDQAAALRGATLAKYDGLIVYANIDNITAEQEAALLDFVAGGKGFIPLHCASYCFRNSEKYIALVGAQFLRHGTGTFRTTIATTDHPLLKGYGGFQSWDETYVHTKHNDKDRTILEYRDDGKRREPWTWTRTHVKGRVFYTAWGHDERTWGHPGFQNLVERGIRWACSQDPSQLPPYVDRPEMTKLRKDVQPFEYVEAKIPFYPPSRQWGVTAAPITKMQKPLPAEESIKHFVTPVGFEVKLFVDETKLGGKPICMSWDERGRLWAALTHDYPNERQPEAKGRDRIVICEDTNADGVCDKVTTFADKLSIPTSLAFAHGGIIVLQMPHTLFLKDTDGDGVADFRQILFTGWGTGDTHAGPSNLRYGLDNWYYGIVGYSAFRGDVAGERHNFRQGFFRFKVEKDPTEAHKLKVAKLEFVRSTSNNSWGVGISEEGLLFGSTANGCPSVYVPIANRYYEKVRGLSPAVLRNIAPDNHFEPITESVRQVDFHGGFTAAAGHALYTARNYPREYWNRIAFVCEPTGHLVAMFELTPSGGNFRARYFGNLLASNDEWSSPIVADVGPDGNVWVIDWYNIIVQHNPTPPGYRTGRGNAYETDLRDKKHGRIYRVVHNAGKSEKPKSLQSANVETLVEALANSNQFWRLTAHRQLVESANGKTIDPLCTVLSRAHARTDDPAAAIAAIHAMHVLDRIGKLDREAENHPLGYVADLLHHPSNAVRSTAISLLSRYSEAGRAAELADYARRQFGGMDGAGQIALLMAISEQSSSWDCAIFLARAMTDPASLNDNVMVDALTIAGSAHAQHLLTVIAHSGKTVPPRALSVLSLIAEHYARGDNAAVGGLMTVLPEADKDASEAILAGLAKSWNREKKPALTKRTDGDLVRLFEKSTPKAKGHLLRLASLWGHKGLVEKSAAIAQSFLTEAMDEKKSEDARVSAIQQVANLGVLEKDTIEKLLALISPRMSPAFASSIIEAIGSSDSPAVAPALLERLPGWPPSARVAAIRVLLSRSDSTRSLLGALESGKVLVGDLALDQRQALANHPSRFIARRAQAILAKGGSLPNPDRQKVLEQLLHLTKQTGDAAAGKVVFKNHCAKCHRHSGEGEQIGPDLTGMAVHSREHLLNEIIDPSRNVEGNFRVFRVELKSGRSLNGLLASETRTSIELIDAEAKRHTLQREDIDELLASNQSLMPEGFEKTVKPEEIVHLLAFLTQRGKFLPLPLDKVATAVSTRGMFNSEDATVERLIFRDWTPKTFEGIPFVLVDPQGEKAPNVILLNGPNGAIPPRMPKSVSLPCKSSASAIHMLSGVSGWGYRFSEKGTLTMIVRLHYADRKTEDHKLINGEHFADYIRRIDVPSSKFAFALRGQQIRYLSVKPQRKEVIERIEFVKGTDITAPVVMAVTVETE